MDQLVQFLDGEGSQLTSENIIADAGDLVPGNWQAVFLYEFEGPGRRDVLVKVVTA